jgi:hypothetical protein
MSARIALAVAAAVLACSHARRAESPAPERPRESTGAPGGSGGVPPAPGRPAAPATPRGLLAPGEVAAIQRALADRGLLGAHREGELDDATGEALMAFQRREGLAATGMPDRETISRLGLEADTAYRHDPPR